MEIVKTFTNFELAQLLRKVAAAYQILNENRFKIIAYERAADSIEHLTSEVKDLWDDRQLNEIPGIGEGISHYLDELFRLGSVKHFDDVIKRVPEAVFPLLLVPGLGPKKAYKLVGELKLKHANTVIADLEKAAQSGKIAPIEGFGDKSEEVILSSIALYKKGAVKENRMELPVAHAIAEDIITYLKGLREVENIDELGSLRRMVATIGDIDLAVATKKPDRVIAHFVKYPHEKIIDEGPGGATLLLHNGRQVDLRVQDPDKYGAMLQYFTGSKNHNIKLRSYGLTQGMSLSEYGIKKVSKSKVTAKGGPASGWKSQKSIKCGTEESFYKALGLPWIPPELREDKGEIEAALRQAQGKPGGLPKLVEVRDLKGDLHIHTNYDLKSSHDVGVDPLNAYLNEALQRGYEYIGLSDHNPKISDQSEKQIIDIMKRRKAYYEQQYSSWVTKISKTSIPTRHRPQIFIMCEVDILPDGRLALPKGAFDYVDAVIISIHLSFAQPKTVTTKRVIAALTADPKVRIFGHPTGRLLTKREGVEIDWKEIFAVCKERDIALEINAHPQRLDLPDTIVYDARKVGLKFCINTDSHAVTQMEMMCYGVSVARRGWCEMRDVVNTMEYNEFTYWLKR